MRDARCAMRCCKMWSNASVLRRSVIADGRRFRSGHRVHDMSAWAINRTYTCKDHELMTPLNDEISNANNKQPPGERWKRIGQF